ncbi:DUF5684 domain-containing protein [Microbacterium sp. cf332]|uniref:DUF5684 domain-containing protein n=1 Tax=Microbacterium sp. cf332 TaxID=1761804 RepID=UPI00088F0FE6|nr:DUF5684 domain-containing protein [Microbacterium sp. cf332]SDQ45317.1 FHA domain-containing protein [Microbacterium sp. cf332]
MTTSGNEPLLILLVVLSAVLGAVLYVWTALALAALFRKVDEEAWQGWVPVLNVAVVLRIAGFSPWLVLVGLIPVAGWLALYALLVVAAHRIGRQFAVGAGMTVLAALLFVVWASILGLGPARWRGARTAASPPPWAFTPPLSEGERADELTHDAPGPAAAGSVPGPAAPPTLASPVLSARHFSPAPFASSGEADEPERLREETPAELQPSPWAPPPPFAPREADEPLAATPAPAPSPPASPAPSAPRPAADSASDPELESEPESESTGDAEPLADSGPGAPTADVSDAPPPGAADAASADPVPADARPAFSEPAPREVRTPILREPAPAPAPSAPEPAVAAGAATPAARPAEPGDDDRPDDARWPSEIDDVSAISPSPFPSRAASDRPGVIPSFADPDAAAAYGPGRRTWDAVPASPIARRAFARTPDEFPELSDEVSAVRGAPAAGAPRTAEAAVPAQLRRAEGADEADVDHTVVVSRRRVYWQLVLPDGEIAPLTGDVAIVGRQPAPDPAFPRAQLVAIDDRTRTVSKTHARLELRSGLWHITDLHSTNGVVLTSFLGTEIELEPGSDAPAGERFLLGDAELRIERPGV